MITVDGQPVNPGGASAQDGEEALRNIRLELKLLKALAALNPPHEVSGYLHARIAELLRGLKRQDGIDQDVRQAADLSDDELRLAAGILRAIHALPTWASAHQGGTGLRVALAGYVISLIDELDTRATRDGQT